MRDLIPACLLGFLLLLSTAPNSRGISQTPAVQGRTSRPNQAQPALAVTECQGVNSCASWKFNRGDAGAVGIGKWPTGEEAILKVTKLDKEGIILTRTDLSGTKAGLTATYTGAFQGGEVVGWYDAVLDGKTEHGPWYWIVNTPANTPLTLTVWHSDGSAPVLFTFSASSPGTRGNGAYSIADAPVTLDRFDGTSIQMTSDSASVLGVDGSYTGLIDGNKISGTVVASDRGHRHSITRSWRGVFGDGRSEPNAAGPPPPTITWVPGLLALDVAIVLTALQPF